MKFHTLIALSEFEAQFDDATLRRPLVARRNPEAAGGGPASEPSRKPEAPTIIPDDDTPQPGMLLPGILDDAPRPVGDTPQSDLVAPRNLMVLPPKLDDAPQPVGDAPRPDTVAPRNPMVLPPNLDDAPQPVGDAPRPVGDAPQPAGDTPRPVGVASNRPDGSSAKKASTPGGDDGLELVDMSGSSIEVQVKHHKDTSAEVQVLLQAYHQEVDALQRRRERYEREIKALDRSIGPRYTKELQYRRLAAEEAALQRRGRELNDQGEAIRLAEEWLRANASRINDRIKAVRANERRIQRRINERRLAEFLRQETPEGVITREDTDGDGKIDQKTLTDPNGNVVSKTEYHHADDGTVDRVVVTTAEGVETHLDTDGDGKIDQRTLTDLEGNQTTDTQYHFADDGTIDRITVTTAEGVETHLDTDGDGKIDQRTLTDLEGNQTTDTQYHYADDGTIDRITVTTAEGVETHLDTDGDGKIDQRTLTDLEGNQTTDTQYHFADDGTIDRITVTTAEGVETHLDTDGDGKIDQKTLIDADGNQTSDTEYRYADDGKVDRITVTTAEGVETRLDTDGDGKIDQRTLTDLEGNQTTDTQYHFADDGTIDRMVVTTAEGVETHLDTDGDGKIDQKTLIDADGNQTSDTEYRYADDGTVDRIVVTTAEGVETRLDTDGDGKIDQRTLTDLEGNQTTDTAYHYADDGTIDRMVVTTAEGVETHLDTDGDGKIDQKTLIDLEGNQTTDTAYHYADDGTIDRMVVTTAEGVETHLDTDGDGKIDQRTLTDLEGNQTSETQYHFADDGTIDRMVVTTAEGVEAHLDTDGDGKIDQRTLIDADGNQTTDTQYHYGDDGTIDRMVVTTAEGVETHLDTDGDGKIDQRTLTDLEGNQTSDTQYHFADDGKVDRITVTTPEGVTVHTDSNGDGKIDYVPLAGSAGDAVELFELNDSGSKPPGSLTREQGTGNWYNASLLEDDSGINLEYVSYRVVNENTIVSDGTVSLEGGGTARVQTTYTRNPDGTITRQSRLINYYEDDAPGSGGGGGGGDATYTVEADGTVKMEQDGHTYTIGDEERAEAIRNADTVDVTEIDQNTPDGEYLTTDGQMVQVSNQDNGRQTIRTQGSDDVTVMDDARYFQRDVAELQAAGQVAVSPEEIDRLLNLGRDLTREWGDTPFAENASAAVNAYVGITDIPPTGVEAGGRQGFDQGLALAELQTDLQRVSEGKSSLTAVLAKWEADPRSATLMLQGPRERLYGEEVGEYEGPPTSISATEWLSQAVAAETQQFENIFRQVTRREPSGNRARDAAVLSQYGENPLTDMGYAAEVQAFENIFRQVTGREPSGDLAKDADILRRYGENAVTDMGYAAEVRQFENIFREVTGREPSGDLAKDAAVLSQYGENPLTDLGYAADVRAFEKTFREVTGREPSGDLAKDADILSRYGENPLTDMGYAAEVRERDYGSVGHDNVSGPLVSPVEPLPEEERYEQLFQQGVKGYRADMIVAAEIEAGTTLAGDPGDRPSRLAVVQEMVEPRPTRDQFPGGPDGYQEFLSTDREWRANFDPFLREHIPANDPRAADLAVAAALAPLPGFWIPAIAGASYYTAASLVPDSPSGRSIRPQELIDPALEALPLAGKGLRFGRSALRQLTGLELNPWSVTRGNVTTQRFTLTEPASDIAEATARYDEMVRQAGFDPAEVRQQIGGYGALRAGLDPNPYAGELGYMIQDVILTGQPRSMVLGDKLLEVTPPSLARRLGGLDFHATPSGGVFADATTVRASSTNPVEMPIFSGPHAYPRFAAGPAFSSGPYQVTDAQDNLLTDFAGQPVMSKGSFEPSVIGRDPANVEVLPKIYPIRMKSGNVIYVKETEVIRPPGAELPAAQFSVPIGGDKMRRTWLPRTDDVSDLERSLHVRVDSAPLMFRSDVPFTRRDIVAANVQSYMDQMRSGIGDLGSVQGIRSRLASSSDPLAEAMPGGGTLGDAPGDVDADISWVDEAQSDLSRTARQQVAGLDDSGLERLASDPTASPDLRDAASELLDVRRSDRAKISEEWVNDAVDPMVREARAKVAMLGDAELRRLASDPSQLPDFRRAANELITLRETARADGISRQVEAERGVPDARSLMERPREVAPREANGHLLRAGSPTLEPRIPDARVADPRIPDARAADPRIPDARAADPRIPDARAADPRIPDAPRCRPTHPRRPRCRPTHPRRPRCRPTHPRRPRCRPTHPRRPRCRPTHPRNTAARP